MTGDIKVKNKKRKMILSMIFSGIAVIIFGVILFSIQVPNKVFPWGVIFILLFLLFLLAARFYWWFRFCEEGTEFWKPENKQK